MRVTDVAGLKVQGARVREEQLRHGVHKVVVRALPFLKSGLEDYKEDIDWSG